MDRSARVMTMTAQAIGTVTTAAKANAMRASGTSIEPSNVLNRKPVSRLPNGTAWTVMRPDSAASQ